MLWNVTWTGQMSSPDSAYFPSYSVKYVSFFMHNEHLTNHDIWISEKVKSNLPQEQKEQNKKHFFLFQNSSLLDIQNKLVKM